jgi:hypothetical protein
MQILMRVVRWNAEMIEQLWLFPPSEIPEREVIRFALWRQAAEIAADHAENHTRQVYDHLLQLCEEPEIPF